MDTVRIGVIGAGYWGPKLIRNFHEISNASVTLVSDLREDRLEHIRKLYPGIQTTTRAADVFAAPIDAVVIATPVATHWELARAALLEGKHVLVEKPMTASSEQAMDLIALAKAHQRILMVGHTFEYNPAVMALKDIIASGQLGQIYYINATRVNLGIFQRDINVVWDLAPHDISILLYILGTFPHSVSARGEAYVQPGIHDVAYVSVYFPDKIMADIRVSWLDPCKIRRITVVGSQRMVVYDDLEPLEKIKIYDKGVDRPPYTDTFEEFRLSYRYGDITSPPIPLTEPLRLECEHFIECVRTGAEPRSNGWSGLRVVKILEYAQRSLLNSGQRETIPW
jgi:predicted dehydrogenase